MGWASLACFTGLVRLMPCFPIKLSLCLYEKAGWPGLSRLFEPRPRTDLAMQRVKKGFFFFWC